MKKTLAILALCCSVLPLTACGPTGSSVGSTIANDAIDCAKQDVGQTVVEVGMTLLADVMSVINAGKDGWKDALDALGKKYGSDAVACAAKDVLDALQHTDSTTPGAHAETITRAQAFLAGKHFR